MSTPIFLHGKNTRVLLACPSSAYGTFSAVTTNGSPSITVLYTGFALAPGMAVSGVGIPSNTYIVSVYVNTVLLSASATATSTLNAPTVVTVPVSNGVSYDLSQFLNDVGISRMTEPTETTTFQTGQSKSYIAGIRDGSITASGFYDGGASGVDAVLNNVIYTAGDKAVLAFPDGGQTGNPSVCYMANAIATKYDLKSPVSGVVAMDTEFQSDRGVWRGRGEYLKITTSGTTNTQDFSTSTAKGGLLVLGIAAVTGAPTSVTLSFQHSQDGATWVSPTGGTLATETGLGATVALLTGTVYEYTRLSYTISGGSSPTATAFYGFARY